MTTSLSILSFLELIRRAPVRRVAVEMHMLENVVRPEPLHVVFFIQDELNMRIVRLSARNGEHLVARETLPDFLDLGEEMGLTVLGPLRIDGEPRQVDGPALGAAMVLDGDAVCGVSLVFEEGDLDLYVLGNGLCFSRQRFLAAEDEDRDLWERIVY